MSDRSSPNQASSQPPEVLRMLAHPLRWQLVQALAASDYRVHELAALVEQPFNLVSYHLKLLRTSGLVGLRKSDADGRDLYYHLELERLQTDYQAAALALYPDWPWADMPPALPARSAQRVLFLCTHNSARSQMAEALLRHLGTGRYLVGSAGTQPRPVRPEAVQVMAEMGIDMLGQRPTHLEELRGRRFDVVITVCDRVREECLSYDFCQANLHWSIPDPAAVEEQAGRRQAFAAAASELERRIRHFIRLGQLRSSTEAGEGS